MKLKLILSDTTGNYPVHIYDGSCVNKLQIEKELNHRAYSDTVHVVLCTDENLAYLACNNCVCHKCPLVHTTENGYECMHIQFYAKRFPSLLNTYPEFFV